MYFVIGKDYLKKRYNNSISDAKKTESKCYWNDEKIIRAFKNKANFFRYLDNNKNYLYWSVIQ